MTDADTSPKYDVAIVEAAILLIADELDPEKLPAMELTLKTVWDANDDREIETAGKAIRGLRECGLFEKREDEIVELTEAARRACALLT